MFSSVSAECSGSVKLASSLVSFYYANLPSQLLHWYKDLGAYIRLVTPQGQLISKFEVTLAKLRVFPEFPERARLYEIVPFLDQFKGTGVIWGRPSLKVV